MRRLTPECMAALAMFLERPWHVTDCYISHQDVHGNPVLTIDDRTPCNCIKPARSDCPDCDGGFKPRRRQYSVLPFGSFAEPMGGIENCLAMTRRAAHEWYLTYK